MSDADDSAVVVDREGPIATVTLNRPDRLNALNRPMWPLLTDAFRQVAGDPSVRVVVLRGAGTAFSPGADISEFQSARADADQARAYGAVMDAAYQAIGETPQPVIARVQGPCTGAGLVLAMLCDVTVGDTSVRMGAPVARLGLSMPAPEFMAVADKIGRGRALMLVLEARVLNAEEAAQIGLLDRLCQPKHLDRDLGALLTAVAAGAPMVHRAHKALARRLGDPTPLTEAEVADTFASFDTADYQEGFRAFLEKRAPAFKGE